MSGAVTCASAVARRRFAGYGLSALVVIGLAACGGDSEAPQAENFAPLDYGYLPKLRLNVADIVIEDGRPADPPAGADADSLSPVSPYDSLRMMASQRLVASGNSGHARFIIEEASIQPGPGRLDGAMTVRLDVETSGGQRTGFAEAKVVRSQAGGAGDPDGGRGAAYRLVKAMMDDMNVELEYQIKHNLRDYLQATDATAPPAAAVATQPLPPPPGISVAPPTPAAPTPFPAPAPVAPALPPLSGS